MTSLDHLWPHHATTLEGAGPDQLLLTPHTYFTASDLSAAVVRLDNTPVLSCFA